MQGGGPGGKWATGCGCWARLVGWGLFQGSGDLAPVNDDVTNGKEWCQPVTRTTHSLTHSSHIDRQVPATHTHTCSWSVLTRVCRSTDTCAHVHAEESALLFLPAAPHVWC